MINDKYGKLTIVEDNQIGNVNRKVKCRCDCGNIKIAKFGNLVYGKTKSCGCEVIVGRITHGKSRSLEYVAWRRMRERCLYKRSENYSRYGGVGVKICDRWVDSFENFYEDMGPKPGKGYSIDRIDNEGDYEPGNCRWATSRQQARNRKSNLIISINGIDKPLIEWVEQLGLKYQTVYSRLKRGVPPDIALEQNV